MNQFAVIGLGTFGLAASRELVRLGNSVIGVDVNQKLINSVAGELTQAVAADATDESSLKELDIAGYDAVLVAIGDSLEASILCVLLLKSLGAKQIWVKATTQPHHTILSKIGVSRIIHPEEEIGQRVAQSLNYPMINQYMPIGNGIYIVEILIAEHCSDFSLNNLLKNAGSGIEPLLVRRKKTLIKDIHEGFTLESQDSLIVTGPLSSLKTIALEFTAA